MDLYRNLLENPDKNDTSFEIFQESIESKYLNFKETSKLIQSGNMKGYSIFHCNTRSHNKNLTLLNDIFATFKETPSIIAILETKLNNENTTNISIPGYSFTSKHSTTATGGVGIYIKNDLHFFDAQT